MPVLTVYPNLDGQVASVSATYLTARAGSSLSVATTHITHDVGQLPGYYCRELFLSFDTSALGSGAVVLSAVLELYGNTDSSATDFVMEARLRDWGSSLETGDWIAGADLGSYPLMAHFDTSGFAVSAYNVFTDDDLAANINTTGYTRLVVVSDRFRAGTVPTANEYVRVQTVEGANDPRLVITYAHITGVGGIASAEAFGAVQLVYGRELVGVGGIASAEAFGLAQVIALKGLTLPAISAFTALHAWSVAAWAKWTSKTAGRVFSAWDALGRELLAIVVDGSASSANRAENVSDNPSLETDLTGWDGSPPRGGGAGVTLSRSNAYGAAPGWGSWAAYVVGTGSQWSGVGYHFPYTFRAGVTYAFYYSAKLISGQSTFAVGIASAAVNTDYSETVPDFTGSWVRYGPIYWTPSADRADAAFYVVSVTAAAYGVVLDGLECLVMDIATVPGAANDGDYHLYVMTYDGATLRFYIDGRAAGADVASSTSLAAAAAMMVGAGYQGANPFGGSLDDLAVFDYYLSASQVAGLYVSGTTSGVDLVHDSSGSSMVLAGWQPHAYMAGYAAVDTYSTALALAANGGSIAIPIQIEGKMALRQVSLWNTDAATARSWNWSLYYQPRQDSISNVLFRIAAGVAADAFTPGAASKRSIAAAGAPTILGPGSYWLVIQNTHATSTFGLGSIASGPLSLNRAQTKTLTVPVGDTLDFTLATWTKVTAIYAVILEGDVLGLWGAY